MSFTPEYDPQRRSEPRGKFVRHVKLTPIRIGRFVPFADIDKARVRIGLRKCDVCRLLGVPPQRWAVWANTGRVSVVYWRLLNLIALYGVHPLDVDAPSMRAIRAKSLRKVNT